MTLDEFIAKWSGLQGGAERANYAPFLTELCIVLGLPTPGPGEGARPNTETLGDYQFDGFVRRTVAGEPVGTGFIDLYRKNSFILEAKQPRATPAETPAAPSPTATAIDLFGNAIKGQRAPAPAPTKAQRKYDALMRDARAQAEGYARSVPAAHGWPPFIIVCDVGRSFDLYFDWSGNGKDYSFFPNALSYRIALDQLRDPATQTLFRQIWTDPAAADPRARAVEVSTGVAQQLANVATWLEGQAKTRVEGADTSRLGLSVEESAAFLMRLLFCMFAESIGLLPKPKFRQFLAEARDNPTWWRKGLEDLWRGMGDPGITDRFSSTVRETVRYFNGNLFHGAQVHELDPLIIDTLIAAAKTEWNHVEPAIFGTLLEHALTPGERGKLGAHFTPKPFVERLVDATMMDVLRPEWEAALAEARAAADAGDLAAARAAATAFHDRLKALAVLDPACGTGNFLYVAMERLMVLEGEIVVLLGELGDTDARLEIAPHQFLGLELNPRAAVIAELVLWIGWLRRRIENDPHPIEDPVLRPTRAINGGEHGGKDAVLARDPTGQPLPRAAEAWPDADFIVGNPPFIGGKDLRAELGEAYVEALWAANRDVPPSADYVMQWWDRAAAMLTAPGARLRRFGLVTTNSIRQEFSRRVIARWLVPHASGGAPPPPPSVVPLPRSAGEESDAAPPPFTGEVAAQPTEGASAGLSLVYAIPDHPWTKQRLKRLKDVATSGEPRGEPAAVRIAMTVAQAGAHEGCLVEVIAESGLDTDTPAIEVRRTPGRVNADLSIGADVTGAVALKANEGLSSPGVKLHGAGFMVTPADAVALGLGRRAGLEAHIREYRNGKDLMGNPRGMMVIDLFGLTEVQVRQRFPEVYQHLLSKVWDYLEYNKKEKVWEPVGRKYNDRDTYKENWWVFGEPRSDFRPALACLSRYIVTVETAKHRVFQFLDAAILPDNKLIAIGSDDAFHLGVLSSSHHVAWTMRTGGRLTDRPVYTKSLTFDPFPFPDATAAQRPRIAALAEELDATRKAAIAARPGRTLTGLYNTATAIRARATLTPEQAEDAADGAATIVARIHEQLDAEVAAAYGWPADLAPTAIVDRLVRLNAERAAEEAAGTVRWLRPDYQARAS